MHVTLTLTTSSSVGVVAGVHGQTTHRGPNVQPAGSSSLSELAMLPGGIADDADGGSGTLLDTPHLTRLQADDDTVGALVARNDSGMGSSRAAEDGTSVCSRPHRVDDGSNGYHVQREAVSTPGCLCGQHTGIDDAAHGGEEIARDAGTVALHNVALAEPVRRQDVALLARGEVGDESDVAGAAGVTLDAVDAVGAALAPVEVDAADTGFVAASHVAHCDAAGRVAASLAVALLGERERLVGATLPEVVIDWPHEMADTRSTGLVGSPGGGRGGQPSGEERAGLLMGSASSHGKALLLAVGGRRKDVYRAGDGGGGSGGGGGGGSGLGG